MNDKVQYDNVCRGEFAEIKQGIKEIHTALFIGNGKPSLKTTLEIHDRYISGIIWLGGVVVSALVYLGIEVHMKK